MKQVALLSFVLLTLSGCRTISDEAILRSSREPFGSTVQAPLTAMIENAYQPDPVLGRILFAYDNADLSEMAQKQLRVIAAEASQRRGLVVVEGHADHTNLDAYNLRLGYDRALAAAHFLRSAGIWDERIVIRSFGEQRPVSSNWKKMGRTLNRSVVVWMYPQGDGATGKEALKALGKFVPSDSKDETNPLALSSESLPKP